MKFCNACDNMYYIMIDSNDSNKLSYYCRNCGGKDVDNEANQEIYCVLHTQLKREEQKSVHVVNKYVLMDPTLPRIYTIPCPNEECSTNKSGETKSTPREVIYIRYDEIKLKYMYMCTTCNHTWHS